MNDTELITPIEAANYTEMSLAMFTRKIKAGTGPASYRMSKRKLRFTKTDLDAWRLSWRQEP